MKTLRELCNKVIESEEMKKELAEAFRDEKNVQKNVDDFLKKYECEATIEELMEFCKEQSEDELSAEELRTAVGGAPTKATQLQQKTEASKAMVSSVAVAFASAGKNTASCAMAMYKSDQGTVL